MFPLLLQTVISNHEATLFEVCPVTKKQKGLFSQAQSTEGYAIE